MISYSVSVGTVEFYPIRCKSESPHSRILEALVESLLDISAYVCDCSDLRDLHNLEFETCFRVLDLLLHLSASPDLLPERISLFHTILPFMSLIYRYQ